MSLRALTTGNERRNMMRGLHAVCCLALVAAVAACGVNRESSTAHHEERVLKPLEQSGSGQFPTNAAGQTYGDPGGDVAPENLPDLVLVQATNGRRGYVLSRVLNEVTGANVSSPAEAVAWQRRQEGRTASVFIPVYDQTGTVVIGEFEVAASG